MVTRKKNMTKQVSGAIVDLGNVIIAHWLSNITPENFNKIDYNSIPEVPEVFESLRRLNEKFGGNITVVYKATDVATEKILAWLAHHKFTERTGIPCERVIRTEGGRDKSVHINQSSSSHCGTTIVVDDRLEVLNLFIGRVPHLFLFHPQSKEVEQFNNEGTLSQVHVVETWKEIEEILNK